MKIFSSFLYPTCVNCLGVSAVVSLKRSSLLFFLFREVCYLVVYKVDLRTNKMMPSEVCILVHAHRHSRVVQCEGWND